MTKEATTREKQLMLENEELRSRLASITQEQDIAGRKRAEDALRQSREDLDRAQQVGQIGSWRLDTRRNVLTWSDESHRIFGIPKGTPLTYETFLSIVHPDDRQYVDTQWQAGLRGEPYDIEHRLLVDGQVKWVREKAYLEFDGAGTLLGGFGITQDVTERKLAEIELKKHRVHLEKVVKELANAVENLKNSNKALEQFSYVVSHDLQEPLATIAGFAGLLEQRYKNKLDDKADKFIKHVTDGCKRMSDLINAILEYSRVGTHTATLEQLDCNDVLRDVIGSLDYAIKHNGAVITYSGLPTVRGDRSQFQQLFQNLIANAIKFRKTEPPEVRISAKQENGQWLFCVEDNGIGMEQKYHDTVFLIFKRLHLRDKYPGTGIGLALCKKIVELHGGKIWVESEPDKGSKFYFTIPMTAKET